MQPIPHPFRKRKPKLRTTAKKLRHKAKARKSKPWPTGWKVSDKRPLGSDDDGGRWHGTIRKMLAPSKAYALIRKADR